MDYLAGNVQLVIAIFVINLIEKSCEISKLLEKRYKITHSEENWLDLIPNRYKHDKIN